MVALSLGATIRCLLMFIDCSIHVPCQKTRKTRGQVLKFRVSKEVLNKNLLLRRKVWEKQQHARRKKFMRVLGKRHI
jgi:hypothetical protein